MREVVYLKVVQYHAGGTAMKQIVEYTSEGVYTLVPVPRIWMAVTR